MKTIKAIISVMLLSFSMATQAQQAITVKTQNGKEAFLLNKRVVLVGGGTRVKLSDGYYISGFVQGDNQRTLFHQRDTIVMYVSSPDEAVAIKQVKAGNSSGDKNRGDIYDLSGRKVSRPAKGIYIQDGKKIAVK